MNVALILNRVEAILGEIESLEREIGFDVREPGDREVFDTVCRIERKMLANQQERSNA